MQDWELESIKELDSSEGVLALSAAKCSKQDDSVAMNSLTALAIHISGVPKVTFGTWKPFWLQESFQIMPGFFFECVSSQLSKQRKTYRLFSISIVEVTSASSHYVFMKVSHLSQFAFTLVTPLLFLLPTKCNALNISWMK
jgi:hypothetical protein